jgi:hypothetical protein
MRTTTLAGAAAALALAVAGCGSSSSSSGGADTPVNPAKAEVNPAGDIPDNQAYVAYAPRGGGFTVKVPEGWSRTATGGAVTFSDKLNSIRVETRKGGPSPTVASVRRTDLPQLATSVRGFQPGTVTVVRRRAGPAVRVTYLAQAKADPVTGKAGRDAVERYVFAHAGHAVVLTLSGPKAADNVDPWHLVTESLTWTR